MHKEYQLNSAQNSIKSDSIVNLQGKMWFNFQISRERENETCYCHKLIWRATSIPQTNVSKYLVIRTRDMRRVLNFVWVRNELLDKEDIGKTGLTKDPEAILIDPNISSAVGVVIQSIESRERASHFSLLNQWVSSFSIVIVTVMLLSLTFEREREKERREIFSLSWISQSCL